MPYLNVPMKQEIYSVAARPLTADELRAVIFSVIDDARPYFDSAENNGGPRSWPSYEAFLGFQIAKAALVYQLEGEALQTVVRGVYDREHDECIEDRERRKGCWPASQVISPV